MRDVVRVVHGKLAHSGMTQALPSSPSLSALPSFAGDDRPAPETLARKLLIRGVAIAALVVSFAYLVWRTSSTVDLAVWWVAVPLLVAEIHNAVGLAIYTATLWERDATPPPEPLTDPGTPAVGTVAVLIPTYNEPEQVLLPTIAAAVTLEPAHETWVLDDGRREGVRQLAEELGAHYLTRPDNRNAKAGNINHALDFIDADIIAIFDADHVPKPNFLRNTLGYFEDPLIAIVQTPQDFYNEDSFEHVGEMNGVPFHEEAVFYRVIGPAKNRYGAAFWAGTCALVRTQALRDVGGVATETVTEDIHTTIRMNRLGWRSVYHNEVLAHGLAPTDAEQYMVQRNRWALGAMQVIRQDNPLTASGLNLGQRLAFASTLFGWFDSWRTLFTGAAPIDAPGIVYGPAFVVTFLMQSVAMRLLARGYYPMLVSLLFDVLRMPAVLPATFAIFGFHSRAGFRVTPKGRVGDERPRKPVPRLLLALLALGVFSVLWFAAMLAGLTPMSYGKPGAAYGAAFFALANLALLSVAVHRIRCWRYAGERRASVRFDVELDGLVDGLACGIEDLSLTGAKVDVPHADWQPASEPGLTVELPDGDVTLRCKALRRSREDEFGVDLGLEFAPGQRREVAQLAIALFRGRGGEFGDAPWELDAAA